MEIEITKKQETINNVPKSAEYSCSIQRNYKSDKSLSPFTIIYNWSLEEMILLRDRLNKDFPEKHKVCRGCGLVA